MRKWQSTAVFLPGESQGQRSLAGYSPWCGKESDTTKRLSKQAELLTERSQYKRATHCIILPIRHPKKTELWDGRQIRGCWSLGKGVSRWSTGEVTAAARWGDWNYPVRFCNSRYGSLYSCPNPNSVRHQEQTTQGVNDVYVSPSSLETSKKVITFCI